jgi:hypothetical protein
MQSSVLCPSCKSSSLSTNKNEEGIEITCLNCGETFKPGEGVTLIKQTYLYIILGYVFMFLCFVAFPIIFMPLSILCGMGVIVDGRWRILHGLLIIVLAITIGNFCASIGGWGLGIPYQHRY